MQKTIAVDASKCVHCGMCIQDCVLGIIEFDDNEIPQHTSGGSQQCVACQHCMAVCPTGALSFGGKDPEKSFPVGFGNSDDLLRLIQSRRSIRFYKNESLPADKVAKLTAMLPYIPTGGNADNLHFSLVTSKEKMEAIRKTTYETILAKKSSSRVSVNARQACKTGDDIVYRGAPSLVAVSIDLAKTIPGCENADPIIALSYIELYAQSLGLGTLWCDMAVMVPMNITRSTGFLKFQQTIPSAISCSWAFQTLPILEQFSRKCLRSNCSSKVGSGEPCKQAIQIRLLALPVL